MINFTKFDIFTPKDIADVMHSKLTKSGSLLEPSVGKGDLLKTDLTFYQEIDVYEIKKDYLDFITAPVNKFQEDFLKAPWKLYDNIIMNPPYIKIQDLSDEYRSFLKSAFGITGMVDIYYAFIIKCISQLKSNGVMVMITPNSYLYNKSALVIRKILIQNNLIDEIIDFKSKKVFPNASVYCCITVINKKEKKFFTYNDNRINYCDIISGCNIFDKGIFVSTNTIKDICKISNGIATLRDKIYIHKEKLFDEPCWHPITDSRNIKYIIYPYYNGKIIQEDVFKTANPNTYVFLVSKKEELAKRDNGNKKYPIWYAYGRSQALTVSSAESVLFIPALNNSKDFFMNKTNPMLFYKCLCVVPNNDGDVEKIEKNIKDNIDFIETNSSKRGSDWFTVSTKTLNAIRL